MKIMYVEKHRDPRDILPYFILGICEMIDVIVTTLTLGYCFTHFELNMMVSIIKRQMNRDIESEKKHAN
jgi:hypothetical protein